LTLAIFDLDNTLIAGDSDHAWGEFLIEQGLVDATAYRAANDQFYAEYVSGALDIQAYLRFALQPLSRFSADQLSALHKAFFNAKIQAMMLPKARELIESHRAQGHRLLIITATNRFITAPIAQSLGIEDLLASDGEMQAGRYTGEPEGIPCFQEGKVKRLTQWLEAENENLQGSYFYSDSVNDVPLLETVAHPCAVDPDDRLRDVALERNWPIISLR